MALTAPAGGTRRERRGPWAPPQRGKDNFLFLPELGSATPFEAFVDVQGAVAKIWLTGHVDRTSCAALRSLLQELVDSGDARTLVVDLGHVEPFDIAALATLAEAARAGAPRVDVKLVHVPVATARMAHATGVAGLLGIADIGPATPATTGADGALPNGLLRSYFVEGATLDEAAREHGAAPRAIRAKLEAAVDVVEAAGSGDGDRDWRRTPTDGRADMPPAPSWRQERAG